LRWRAISHGSIKSAITAATSSTNRDIVDRGGDDEAMLRPERPEPERGRRIGEHQRVGRRERLKRVHAAENRGFSRCPGAGLNQGFTGARSDQL